MAYDCIRDLSKFVGVNVMIYDYTGYGSNGGRPSEAQCYEDIEAAFRYLVESTKINPRNIILYGRSLGTGPSCHLTEKLLYSGIKIGGLILQSPMLSAYRIAANFAYTLPGDIFANIDVVRRGGLGEDIPVLIIHGTHDEIVPFWHGQELFFALSKSSRAKPFWVLNGGHNNLEALTRADGTFFARIREFIDYHSIGLGLGAQIGPGPALNMNMQSKRMLGLNVNPGIGAGTVMSGPVMIE